VTVLEVAAGRIEAQAEAEEQRRDLALRLFGPVVPAGADVTSRLVAVTLWRDGLARASRCSEADAVELFELAEASGDEQLARALCAGAVHRGWSVVLEAFAASHPGSDVDVDTLLSPEPKGT